jgi:hypothetical protein
MNTDLRDFVLDEFDDSMVGYLCSKEYRETDRELNQQIADFRSTLSPDQALQFNRILNCLSDQHSEVALEAYYRGFIKGVGHDVE